MTVCQNLAPLVNIKIAGKWMFIPLKMVSIGIDPYPYDNKSGSLKPFPPSIEVVFSSSKGNAWPLIPPWLGGFGCRSF